MASGTRTGLKMRKSGVATARPIIDPMKLRPERRSRVPPTGRRVMMLGLWRLMGVSGHHLEPWGCVERKEQVWSE